MRGLLITFEGIEGSGKSTLLHNVASVLRRSGADPVTTREPGGTALGAALRKVLLNPEEEAIVPLAELMLFAADRAQHVSRVIKPALVKGHFVLCDRYSDATVAYQGYGRGLSIDTILAVDRQARNSVSPDLTVLLDLPVEKGLIRARTRNDQSGNNSESRIDEEELVFHERVRTGYLALADGEPERFLVLDALNSPDQLSDSVISELQGRFPGAV